MGGATPFTNQAGTGERGVPRDWRTRILHSVNHFAFKLTPMGLIALRFAGLASGVVLSMGSASAQQLTADVEALRIGPIGVGWTTIETLNTYTSPVIACVHNIKSFAEDSAVVRMRSVGPTSFQIRLQSFNTAESPTPSTVHCLAVDEGVHTLRDGRRIEAHTVLSTRTANGNPNSNWNGRTENVTARLSHAYGRFVVLGQVMTANDPAPSVFWTHNGVSRQADATPTAFFVGKHTGQVNTPRANETVGFITIDGGTGVSNDVAYTFDSGADTVQGTANSPPFTYSLPGDYDTAVATQNAEDGGNGGWAVLWGPDPLPSGRINLAIEEETAVGDSTRRHTAEPVFYGAFRNDQTADVTAAKTVTTDPGAFSIPGAEVAYTLTVQNDGSAPLAEGSLFFTDPLPAEVELFTGDLGGAGSGPVTFDAGGTALTFTPSTDIGFASSAPTGFADCTATANGGFDATITHLCLRPGGRLAGGTLSPGTASFTFRARIK